MTLNDLAVESYYGTALNGHFTWILVPVRVRITTSVSILNEDSFECKLFIVCLKKMTRDDESSILSSSAALESTLAGGMMIVTASDFAK